VPRLDRTHALRIKVIKYKSGEKIMSLRLCSYNIEWFNHLFNKDNTLKSGSDEQKRLNAITNVLLQINPDFLGIIEAPNTSADG